MKNNVLYFLPSYEARQVALFNKPRGELGFSEVELAEREVDRIMVEIEKLLEERGQ